jgi:hypothetical protein
VTPTTSLSPDSPGFVRALPRRLRRALLGLVLLAACSSAKVAVKSTHGGATRDEPEVALPPVSLTLFRQVGGGTEIEARRNAYLFADPLVRVKVTNRTGHSLYIKVEQSPDDRGQTPLDAPELAPTQAAKGNGLYKLDEENSAPLDFPIHKGIRGGKVVLRALESSNASKSFVDVKVVFRPQPALEFYGADDLPMMNRGQPVFKPESPNTPEEQQHRFYVELVPGPLDGSTCAVALESASEDGTLVGQVQASLSTPEYRDGPFRTISGSQVMPNADRYRHANAVDGDPSLDPSTPSPRDRTELITVGEIHVRRAGCN